MKKIWIALVLGILFASQTPSLAAVEEAHGRTKGIDFILGEPSGFSFQFKATSPETINGGMAWSFDHWFQVWADYAWHFPRFVSDLIKEHTAMDAYIGLGGGIIFQSSQVGGIFRVPLGLEYKLNRPPLGFFLELVPGLVVSKKTEGHLQGGIGARFYF